MRTGHECVWKISGELKKLWVTIDRANLNFSDQTRFSNTKIFIMDTIRRQSLKNVQAFSFGRSRANTWEAFNVFQNFFAPMIPEN